MPKTADSLPRGKVTERTFYPKLIDQIRENGGQSVSEVLFNSEPDIIFDFADRQWILSVKIGETPAILKQAFIQYQRHKEETKRDHGLILFLPESIRSIRPVESEIVRAAATSECTCLLDTPVVKDELRAQTFPQILGRLKVEVIPAIARAERRQFPFDTVLALLRQHVLDMMQEIHLTDAAAYRVIADKRLLSGIGRLTLNEAADASRFLASYILLSQVLFLRLFSRTRTDVLPELKGRVTRKWLRQAFDRVLDINYKPIFGLDVLNLIPEDFAQDTFHLIWGLEVERARYELPGRLFHELMPPTTRKMLAAFYTRPQAAELLARLTIQDGASKVFDPACGSGTILVAAYRRKLELLREAGRTTNPHKEFCEEQLAGSDIMPFAVHLTSANLASVDPAETIAKTQIVEGDSLGLSPKTTYASGVQTKLMAAERKGYTMRGERHDVDLSGINTVMMNPPFTKVERGIRNFVDMEKFGPIVGNEVGLWGHFIPLALEFLPEGGDFGAVLPVNLLRGRESSKTRTLIFDNLTSIRILKPAINYGFSEWAEYGDILLIGRKGHPTPDDTVKFAIVKKNLQKLTGDDISHIEEQLAIGKSVRSGVVDVDSHTIAELRPRFDNLMWYCGVADLSRRDALLSFISKAAKRLSRPPADYFGEGYTRRPTGVASFMFLTRNSDPSRVEEAFLRFDDADVGAREVVARSELGTEFHVERSALLPSLRTGVGLKKLDITDNLDFVAKAPYNCLDSVRRASGFKRPKVFHWKDYWDHIASVLPRVETNIVMLHRVNPYSPHTHSVAFCSRMPFSPSDMLRVVRERDETMARAFCAVANSVVFWAQFFLLKEQTNGRFINITSNDLHQMHLVPEASCVGKLVDVYDRYAKTDFPALRDQFDSEFDARYAEFWQGERKQQQTLDAFGVGR